MAAPAARGLLAELDREPCPPGLAKTVLECTGISFIYNTCNIQVYNIIYNIYNYYIYM
jgi:hypothetical protein